MFWPELTGVCACWGGITLVAPYFFSVRYHCRSCCSPLSKIAREFFSSWLEALLTHSKLAQHFPLVREHLNPTNKSRVQKQPGASGCCHFWWQWRKERGQGWGNWWQMGFRRERGSSSKTAVEWLEPGEPTGVFECFKGGDNFPIISSSTWSYCRFFFYTLELKFQNCFIICWLGTEKTALLLLQQSPQ